MARRFVLETSAHASNTNNDTDDERGPRYTPTGAPLIELSVVMPCLNEADTLATCVDKARATRCASRQSRRGHRRRQRQHRRLAARSPAALGARVVPVSQKGYGNALMGGIAAARGRYVIMGDADDSYDFREIPRFVAKLREGYELVQGCRLPSGGGTVDAGRDAVPPPLVGQSRCSRSWRADGFGAPDPRRLLRHCAAFTKDLYERLDQRCTGMEFATEMIIKASLIGAQIAEVPITLHPDGRKAHAPHLRTFRDGWRTLRFFLMYSPRWLFLVPGALLILLGAVGYALAMPGVRIGRVTFDAHTLLFASLAILAGYQSILFAVFTKTFAISEGCCRRTRGSRASARSSTSSAA